MPKPLSPRAARTRTALISAGLDLLADRPVDGIAVDELVEAAGVAKGSFFNHFTDKHAFAAAVADGIRAELEAAVDRFNADETDPLDRLTGGMVAVAAFALAHPSRAAILMRTARHMVLEDHPLNRGVLQDMRASVKAGVVGNDADQAGLLFWLGSCHALMSAIVAGRWVPAHAAEQMRPMLRLSLRGLGVCAQDIDRQSDPARLETRLARALADGFRSGTA